MRRLPAAALAVLFLILPAASQSASQSAAERIARAVDIPVEDWRAMADGRTLTYRINEEFWALEHYYRGTNRVQLQLYDGSCLSGTWAYVAPHYCFYWEDQGPSCFRHARLGDEVLIIETQGGQDTAMTQSMTAITDTPLACGPAAVS